MASLLHFGVSQAGVAKCLNRNPGTISRERSRSARPGISSYIAHFGQLAYARKRKLSGRARRKFGSDLSTPLWQRVIADLRRDFSPEQSAGRMRYLDSMFAPFVPSSPLYASHQTIYKAIYDLPHSPQRSELTRLLTRSSRGRRRPKRGSRHTGLQNTTPLAERPAEVALRNILGHWEGDLIKGARNGSAVGTLVERACRVSILVPLRSACANDVYEGFRYALAQLPAIARKSLTYDRGSEMARHQDLSKALDMPIYFCPAYSPGCRGTNENTNGLLRRYMPKSTDLSAFTASKLAPIQDKLNNRPRRILGYRTPNEVFNQMLRDAVSAAA